MTEATEHVKWSSLKQYIGSVIDTAGSDLSVGKYLGLADGSRVGAWRKGRGRPSELMCIKLARWQGDDPLRVLRLAGYTEMADLLEGSVPATTAANTHSVQLLQNQLTSLKTMVEMALAQTSVMGVGEAHAKEARRHPKG